MPSGLRVRPSSTGSSAGTSSVASRNRSQGQRSTPGMAKLAANDAALFGQGVIAGGVKFPAPAIPEPHGSWVPLIEAAWLERYGV